MTPLENEVLKLVEKYHRISPPFISKALKVSEEKARELFYFSLRQEHIEAKKIKEALINH